MKGRYLCISVLLLSLLVLCAIPAQSMVIYVTPTGSDNNSGLTWDLAKSTVIGGLNSAASGDEIWVAAGTYYGGITMKDGVVLYGGFNGTETARTQRNWEQSVTALDASNVGSVVTVPTGITTVIDGFTIRNGKGKLSTSSPTGLDADYDPTLSADSSVGPLSPGGYKGGGVYCAGAATIANNTIENNSVGNLVYAFGGGIYCTNNYTTIANNLIRGNTALYGGAIYCSVATLTSTKIIDNTIVGNNSSGYGALSIYGSPLIANNTIVDNSGSPDAIYIGSGSSTIANNIVAFNPTGISSSSTVSLSHNDVYGNTVNYSGIQAGIGDISAEPLFVDRSNGNYHLQSTSPCIDKGDDSIIGQGWLDLDDEPRQVEILYTGVKVDIGADEYYPDYKNSPIVDHGLPTSTSNLNNDAGSNRCNIRWGDSSLNIGYGDDFTPPAGPQWVIDSIRIWAVPHVPVTPAYYFGDHYQNVALYGAPAGMELSHILDADFAPDSDTASRPNVVVTPVTYLGAVKYQTASGDYNQLWQIDFLNLNWTVQGGTKYTFGVYGTPCADRTWFEHACNAALSGWSDPDADGMIRRFIVDNLSSGTTLVSGSGWFGGKGSDINVQVFAHPQ